MNKVETVSEGIKMDLPEKVWSRLGAGILPYGTVMTKPRVGLKTAVWGSSRKAVENLHGGDISTFVVEIGEAKLLTKTHGYDIGIIYNEDLIEIGRFTV